MNAYSAKQDSAPSITRSSSQRATFLLNNKNMNTEESIIELLHRHESRISDLQTRLAEDESSESSQQVRLLQAIHALLASQSTPLQFIWNAALQTVVVIIAFLFGMFSIFSWHGRYKANKMTTQANQISLLSICLSNNIVSAAFEDYRRIVTTEDADTCLLQTTGACAGITDKADDAISYLLGMNFGGDAVKEPTVRPWPVVPYHDLTILLVYIFVPVLAGAIGSFACWRIYHERGRHLFGAAS
jgi:hypothetical protein